MTACPATPMPYESALLAGGESGFLRPGGAALTGRLLDLGGWKSGDCVIDVGCGRGEALALLGRRGVKAIGVDPAAKGEAGQTVIAASAESLPFAGAAADGIVAQCSFSLVRDKGAALREFRRVLRPAGRLAIADLFLRSPILDPDPAPLSCLAGLSTRAELETELNAAGFTPLCWEDHSDALTRLAAWLLFEHGTLDALWGGAAGGERGQRASAWMKRHRPGYALVVASRKADAER